MTLAERMREAADVLEEASKVYGYFDPVEGEWCARRLRDEAEHVEAEGL